MTHRINIMLDDEVWEQFQTIPGGERSRFVNEVVAQALQKRRQLAAWEGLQVMRAALPSSPGHSEDWVREDRDAHA